MRYSDNYNLKLPQRGVDRANVDDLDDNFEVIDGALADDRQIGLLMYDSTATYNTGAIRGYENPSTHRIRAYRCLEDNVTGSWDATKWAQTTLAAEIENSGGGGGSSTLAGLSDVSLGTLADGEVLTYDATEGKWVNAEGGSGGASELSDLDDVSLDTPTEGQILTYDGDEWVNTDAPDVDVTKTASGNPIEVSDGANAPLVKCVSAITGSQDLHGYDKPWVGGAGKNKIDATTVWSASVASDGSIDYPSGNTKYYIPQTLVGQTLTFSAYVKAYANNSNCRVAVSIDGTITNGNLVNTTTEHTLTQVTFTPQSTSDYVVLANSGSNGNYKDIQLESGSTATSYEPYSNICPITAYTEGEIEVSDGDGNTTTHTTTYPSAIYRGSEDCVKGEVTSEWEKAVFDGTENWQYSSAWSNDETNVFYCSDYLSDAYYVSNDETTYLSNEFEALSRNNLINANRSAFGYSGTANNPALTVRVSKTISDVAAFKTWLGANNLEIAYRLATPTTSSVTTTNLPVKSLNGYSHIESSTGDMEIEYITGKYQPIVDLISESSGGDSQHHYSTDEQVVGTWIDGSDVYERVDEYSSESVITAGDWRNTQSSGAGIAKIIECVCYQNNTCFSIQAVKVNNDVIQILTPITIGITGMKIRYTKTSQSRSAENLSKGGVEEKKAEELLEEKKEEPSEPITESLETKTDSLSKDEKESIEEDESKEIEDVTEEPKEVIEEPEEEPEATEEEPTEEPVDPEPSKEEADER